MIPTCEDTQYVLDAMYKEGNTIKEVQHGWSEIKEVILMTQGISETMRLSFVETLPQLEYWSFDGSPLDPPDEGFPCKKCSVAVSFPRAESDKRKSRLE